MLYKEIAPPEELAPFIKCFWILEDKEHPGPKPLQKVLPDACPELIIHYGDRFRVRSSGKTKTQPPAFVFGPLTKHIEIGPTGAAGMIAARFYPGALSAFLPLSIKKIADAYLPLDKLFGKSGAMLESQVCKARNLKERKALLETFLLAQLYGQKRISTLLPYLPLRYVADNEPVKIADLSKQMNIGRRHLERKFNEQVGMTPRLFLKIMRFQNIFKIISAGNVKNLTDLTYRAGYFDQSHFYRDFKTFSGSSPKEHFKEDAALTKLFTSGQ